MHQHSRTSPPTQALGDILAVASVATLTGGSVLMLVLHGDASNVVTWVVAGAGLAALAGMWQFRLMHTARLLWASIGVNVGLGATGLLSFGTGSLVVGIVCAAWAIVSAERLGLPAIDRQALVAELLGFFSVLVPVLVLSG